MHLTHVVRLELQMRSVVQGKTKTGSKPNGKPKGGGKDSHNKSSGHKKSSFKGKCAYCGKWGHQESECDNNPANRKFNSVPPSNKRTYPSANGSSAGGNKRKFLSKDEFLANLKAKRELEQNHVYEGVIWSKNIFIYPEFTSLFRLGFPRNKVS